MKRDNMQHHMTKLGELHYNAFAEATVGDPVKPHVDVTVFIAVKFSEWKAKNGFQYNECTGIWTKQNNGNFEHEKEYSTEELLNEYLK